MNKFKYALYHGKYVIIVLILVIIFASSFVFDIIRQLNSAKDGIEVLLINTAVTNGNARSIEKDIESVTGVKYVGAGTLLKKEADEYVKTIKNYTLHDYIYDLTMSKNCEVVFVTKSLLSEVYLLKNIVPLSLNGEFGEECFYNGVLYAYPMKNAKTQELTITSVQEDVYMVLLNGDHLEDAKKYLNHINGEN